ncbi:MAG: hypothetical protein IT369_01330 [Candidatus Latescibacteria bacterium]|nr:hypothetical protein [Candidatus Latescibacterota bacterium]
MRPLIAALLLSLGTAWAQPALRLNLYSSYTDNLVQSNQPRADWIHLLYADLDWGLAAGTSLYYTGNASLFGQYRELFNHAHALGLNYTRDGRAGQLRAGLSLSTRLDRRLYDYRDFVGGGAFVEAKRYLREDLVGRAGYTLRLQEYRNVSRQSYVEQNAAARLTRFLPSRTTVDLRAELGVKSYLRRGEGVLPGAERGRHLVQGSGGIRLAQSLGAGTGINLDYTRQHSFSGQGRFLLGPLYDFDDELFSDRYSYQGQTLGLTLKHLGLWGSQLELDGQLGSRDYVERLALDLNGLPLSLDEKRRDHWQLVELELVRFFQPARSPGFEAGLHWSHRRTNSNDPYYDARVNTYSLSLEYSY